MKQHNRHMHQPSSNELRSLNDNLDENIQRQQAGMPTEDADVLPVTNHDQQNETLQTPPEDGDVQNRITK